MDFFMDDQPEAAGDEVWPEDDFFSELEQLVDIDVVPEEVLFRIEDFILWLIEEVAEGDLPTLEVASRTARNCTFVTDHTVPGDNNQTLRLQQATRTLSLVSRQAEGAYAYVRIFKVMEVVHELVRTGKTATLRDIYYRLLCAPIVASPRDINKAVQDVISILRVSRCCLNICCSSRGAVAGRLWILEPGGQLTDCSCLGNAGRAIPGDVKAIRQWILQCDADCIIVIEKDAAFQRLVEDRFFDMVSAVLITAKGMPDVATRVFLHVLHCANPRLPVLALVDWNPSGVNIMKAYKYGSAGTGLESPRYAIPGLKWLGVRHHMLAGVDNEAWQPLTRRDRSLLRGLKAGPLQAQAGWGDELTLMEQCGHKADIEALYSGGQGLAGLAPMLAHSLLLGDVLH